MKNELYKTEPLKCYGKAKELRDKYYSDYQKPGKIHWVGGAWTLDALAAGLGPDVVHMTGEPFGASVSLNKELSTIAADASEAKGWSRDLCSYMRNYWGAMYLKKFAFGGELPKPDFALQSMLCCMHAKWYQNVAEHYGIPMFCVDMTMGPYPDIVENPYKLDFAVSQCHEVIKGLEKTTGRTYDDERLIHAVYNECRITSTWAEICALNQNVPAPLDEKMMFALYVLASLDKTSDEIADFYDELLAEVKDRVARNIAALPTERYRFITDSQPPWSIIKEFYGHMAKYGAVSIGSIYTFGLMGIWDSVPHDGYISLIPAKTPQSKGIILNNRDEALRCMCDWNFRKPQWPHFYDTKIKTDMMLGLVKDYNAQGVIMHFNRGCQGSSLGVAENRLGLIDAGVRVMTYEASMGDDRDTDLSAILSGIDIYMESLGIKPLS